MGLKYEPTSEPLHISVKSLFLDCYVYLDQDGNPVGIPGAG